MSVDNVYVNSRSGCPKLLVHCMHPAPNGRPCDAEPSFALLQRWALDGHQVSLETHAAYRSLGVRIGALRTFMCLNSPRIAKATSASFS